MNDHIAGELEQAAAWIREAGNVVVFTGAGVSTESGIPDFRGPQGIWKKVDASIFEFKNYLRDPEVRKRAWQMRRDAEMWNAEPNPSHAAIAELESICNMTALITQNIDRLHHAAGSHPEKILEIHGNILEVGCLDCKTRWPTVEILDRVEAGEEDPRCSECGGIMKTATISFGQSLDPDVLAACETASREADFFLVAGSSLVVTPAAHMPVIALQNRARLMIVNLEPTPLDDLADIVVSGPTGEILPALSALLTA